MAQEESDHEECTKSGWLTESHHGRFLVRKPVKYLVYLNSKEGYIRFNRDESIKSSRIFSRTNSKLAEKEIPFEEIKSVEKDKRNNDTFIIRMKQLAASVQSGALLTLAAANEIDRDSWVHEIEKVIWTNTNGGLNLVREEISDSIHKFYEVKIKSKEGLLGTGMSGEVRCIYRRKDAKPFAMKTVSLSGLSYFKLKSLQSEIEILKSLDHPHIVRVYETFVEPKLCVRLVMELCEGGELFDRLARKGRFDEKTTCDITRQMLKALNYLHENHVVHRDIKLENWLFRHDDERKNDIVLIDFGLSRRYRSESERMHKAVGTSYYAAPEVIHGDYAGCECDVWSVGVITYMLLSGKAPFDGNDDDEIILKISSHQKPRLKGGTWDKISKEGKSFVRSLLKVDPTKRATAFNALNHEWMQMDVEEAEMPEIDDTIFASLKKYTKYHELKRIAMEFIAYSMSHDEIKQLKELFEAVDKENNGFITFEELRSALLKHGAITEEEIKEIFDCMDESHQKRIRLNEFVAACLQTKFYQDEQILSEAFSHLDTNNTGKITVEDLKHILGRYESDEEIEEIMRQATKGNGDEITYNDFLVLMRDDGERKATLLRNSFKLGGQQEAQAAQS